MATWIQMAVSIKLIRKQKTTDILKRNNRKLCPCITFLLEYLNMVFLTYPCLEHPGVLPSILQMVSDYNALFSLDYNHILNYFTRRYFHK